MRPHKLISLTVAAVVASATAATSGALAADSLSGSGSTLVAPLEVEWAQAFKTFYGITVECSPVGSQTGVQAISARTVDFGASDAPMTASQVSACHSCLPDPVGAHGDRRRLQRQRRDTYVFTNYLSDVSSSWRRRAGQAVGPALDFAPLPPVIRRAATATVRAFSR